VRCRCRMVRFGGAWQVVPTGHGPGLAIGAGQTVDRARLQPLRAASAGQGRAAGASALPASLTIERRRRR
jgi:hypothetical protein